MLLHLQQPRFESEFSMHCQLVDDYIDRSSHALVVGRAVMRDFIGGGDALHGHPPAQERYDQPDPSDSFPAFEQACAAACAGIQRPVRILQDIPPAEGGRARPGCGLRAPPAEQAPRCPTAWSSIAKSVST